MVNSIMRAKHVFARQVGAVSIAQSEKTVLTNRAKNVKAVGRVPFAIKRAQLKHVHRNAHRKAFALTEHVNVYTATKDAAAKLVSS